MIETRKSISHAIEYNRAVWYSMLHASTLTEVKHRHVIYSNTRGEGLQRRRFTSFREMSTANADKTTEQSR